MKDTERDEFWLDLGPAADYYGMPCAGTAAKDGDASPDGLRHGFTGAEPGKGRTGSAGNTDPAANTATGNTGRFDIGGDTTDTSNDTGTGTANTAGDTTGDTGDTNAAGDEGDDLFLPRMPVIPPQL